MTNRIAITAALTALLLLACRRESAAPAEPAPRAPAEATPRAWPDPGEAEAGATTASVSEPIPAPAPASISTATATAARTASAAPQPRRDAVRATAADPAESASSRAEPVGATPADLTPPTAPAQLTAAALGEGEIELRWTAATDEVGVAGYEVVRDGRVIAGGSALTTREKGLGAYTEHCYAVRAFDAAGNRSPPSPAACARTLDLTPPSTPLHVVASATSDRSVQVLWQASTDDVRVDRYEVLREGEVVAEPSGAWGDERGLRPGVRYCYAVRAVDEAGNRSPASAVACAVTPDVTPPSVPEAIAAQPVSSTAMFLAWEASTDDVGVTGYEVVGDGEVTAKVSRPEVLAAALPAGKHCFRVRALDGAGNRSALSAAACTATADPELPPAPFRLQAEPASEKAVRLSWQPSPSEGVVYRVYWEDGKTIGATRLTGFSAVGLKPGERHCYRVGALDEHGHESPRTLEACAASRAEALSAR